MMIILSQRIIARKMTARQLTDAVNNLIDNYRYPIPTIAEVIGFDKKVKVYTHQDVVKSIQEGFTFENYDIIEINGQKRWTLKN